MQVKAPSDWAAYVGRNNILRESSVKIGTVRWYDAEKGLVSIRPDDGPADYIAPLAAIQTRLQVLMEGQRVRFEADAREPTRQAANIRPV
jgi:cold shock CspA family protein